MITLKLILITAPKFNNANNELATKVYSPDFKRKNIFLYLLAVKDGHRGKGIGSSMVKYLISEVKAGLV